MRKITIILITLMFALPLSTFAVDEPFGDDPLDVGTKKIFIIEDRRFELGIACLNVNFANNFLSTKQIFQDTIRVNLDDFANGLKVNFGLDLTPIYFNFQTKRGWGFGLSTDVEGVGILGLSGNMLTLNEAEDEISDVSGALFASVTINSNFNIEKFKVRFSPSTFYSLVYIKPEAVTYHLSQSGGTTMWVGYNLQVFTGIPMENFGDEFSLTTKPGFDFSVGVEYPLAKELGISKKIPFLEFDVGLDLINVPLAPSKMYDLLQMNDLHGSKAPVNLNDDDFFDEFISSLGGSGNEPVYTESELKVYRPFKMLIHAKWRPLYGSKMLTVMPVFGFCINDLYTEKFSIEAGLNTTFNLANCFISTLGFNYKDRMHVYSLDFAFNFRAFELDIGADIRSQDIKKAWTGAGFGVRCGFKFGW